MPGRTIAIGDIHGCDVALETLLGILKPTADDTIVVLGDVVDRGPNTKRCIEQLIVLRDQCKLVFIQGNHEEMMLQEVDAPPIDVITGWRRFGGLETLASYGSSFDDIPASHLRFLEESHDYWKTETDLFIHASLEPGVKLKEQKAEWLRWNHLTGFETPHPSGKRIICGHTAQASGIPWLLDGWICIDTKAHVGNPLTAFDATTDHFYQANALEEARDFSLDELIAEMG